MQQEYIDSEEGKKFVAELRRLLDDYDLEFCIEHADCPYLVEKGSTLMSADKIIFLGRLFTR